VKLCVTGTREGRPDVAYWLDRWVRRFGLPELLIVGDARGVDTETLGWGRERAAQVLVVHVNEALPSPQRYHDRNERMARRLGTGDWCLGFPGPHSRGTQHTMGLCRQRGARVYACPLREKPL
jgi:hypothetical protein